MYSWIFFATKKQRHKKTQSKTLASPARPAGGLCALRPPKHSAGCFAPLWRIKKSFLLFLTLLQLQSLAQKTDKVYLKNGDVTTGEIKSMKLAKLKFDMTGPGVIYIKWEEVIALQSDKTFEITLDNGSYFISRLDSIFLNEQKITLDQIVEIVTVRKSFIKRLEGDINIGLNYTRSNSILQFNFGSTTTYRKPKAEINLVLNHIISKTADTISSRKQDVTLGALKRISRRYYLMSNAGWEKNTQLGLENRFLLAGGAGKILMMDNHKRLLTGTGLTVNREKTDKSGSYNGNFEALALIQFKKFNYSFPKVSIDALYIIYPSLSDWGRIRMNLQINTSYEIFKDFLVGFTFYDNYDNRSSSSSGSTNNDYGLTFTIGFTFGK